jgi:putative phage-type endonuclease
MAIYEQAESYAVSRAGGIGGTDAAAILGLSPYKTPIEIYEAKINPESVPELDKECLLWGTLLEPIVRERYGLKYGVDITAPADLPHVFPLSKPWKDSTLVIGDEPWKLGAFDGWINDEREGYEGKCASRRSGDWGPEDGDDVPAHYRIQVAWYTHVADARGWNIGTLFSGNTLERFHIPRDPELEKNMVEVARDFWNENVLKQIPPKIDETVAYGKYLARRFSLPTGKVLTAPSQEIIDAATELHDAQAAAKSAESREQFAKNQLMAALADADGAITPLGKVSWVRPGPRSSVDYKGVFAECCVPQAIIDKFTKQSPVTAFVRGWWK